MKKVFGGLLALVIILGVAWGSYVMFGHYGEGYRVGSVLKLSNKGYVFKTWEGELSQAQFEQDANSTGGVGTRIWYFTLKNDPQLLENLNHAVDQGGRVKLYYYEKLYVLPWLGDTRHLVYKAELLSDAKAMSF